MTQGKSQDFSEVFFAPGPYLIRRPAALWL